MGVTLEVPFAVLQTARAEWDQAADGLDGSWRGLHRTETTGFSAAVEAAVVAFREEWVDEIKLSAERAQACSDEIVFFRRQVLLVDVEQAEQVRSLLPWAQRDAAIHE